MSLVAREFADLGSPLKRGNMVRAARNLLAVTRLLILADMIDTTYSKLRVTCLFL